MNNKVKPAGHRDSALRNDDRSIETLYQDCGEPRLFCPSGKAVMSGALMGKELENRGDWI